MREKFIREEEAVVKQVYRTMIDRRHSLLETYPLVQLRIKRGPRLAVIAAVIQVINNTTADINDLITIDVSAIQKHLRNHQHEVEMLFDKWNVNSSRTQCRDAYSIGLLNLRDGYDSVSKDYIILSIHNKLDPIELLKFING